MKRVEIGLGRGAEAPVCVGVGFVAIDLVNTGARTFAAVGGSCGNVMAILAWLGWKAVPVARLGRDWAAEYVRREWRAVGADLEFVTTGEGIQTPIVVQQFVEGRDGNRRHRFSFTCPECGGWLPRYRSTTLEHAACVMQRESRPRAFYFDRVSPAALRLARWARERGAIVVFEPSKVGDERGFGSAVDVSHVVKCAEASMVEAVAVGPKKMPMVVQTGGSAGLRFRWQGRWQELAAFEVARFRDAAGAGDWCTAGFIHVVAERGAVAWGTLRVEHIVKALRFGQAMAAINCAYEGARGAMIALTREQMGRRECPGCC